MSKIFSRSILQANITNFSGKSGESVDGFLDEVHLAFTHTADAYTEKKDPKTAHLHLVKSHCDGRAKEYIRSPPKRQRTKAAEIIASLESASDEADEEDSREVRAHGAMLKRKWRRDKSPAKYARRARCIADHINPKHVNLMAIKFRDGFRSRSLKRHLSIRDDAGKTSFEKIYRRLIDKDRFQ